MKTHALTLTFGVFLAALTSAAPPDAPTPKPAAPAQPKFRFQAYDGNRKKDGAEKMAFQVTRLDVREPTNFLRLGDTINGTTYMLHSFEYKSRLDPKLGKEDVSELTLMDTATSEAVVLILGHGAK